MGDEKEGMSTPFGPVFIEPKETPDYSDLVQKPPYQSNEAYKKTP